MRLTRKDSAQIATVLRHFLKRARIEKGLTQVEATNLVRGYRNYVHKLETGAKNVTVIDFLLLCSAYELDPCKVLKQLG